MKKAWIKYLKDPIDGTPLDFDDVHSFSKQDRITTGNLVSKTKNVYKIIKGIPVLLTTNAQSLASVESFAYEWDQFGFLFAKTGWFQDLMNPLVGSEKFFKNKIIVDAGAGSGSQSRWMVDAGAKFVFSLELSNAIFSEHAKTIRQYEDKIYPIQCDIANPPLNVKPDIIYCMNVIQHTKNPTQTLIALAKLMSKQTVFLFNIYDKDRNSLERLNLIRCTRAFTRFLPFAAWKWLAFLYLLFLYTLARIPFMLSIAKKLYPLGDSFKGDWLNLYDIGGAHFYQDFYTKDEQLSMIKMAGLKIKKQTKFGYVLTR